MKRCVFVVVLLLVIATSAYAAQEKWFIVGQWYSGKTIEAETVFMNNTEIFKSPSVPWGVMYNIEKIDKTMPMTFNVVMVPKNNTKYDQEPVCIAASSTMKGSYRIHNKSPENYLMINSINCRWTIGVFKIINPKK